MIITDWMKSNRVVNTVSPKGLNTHETQLNNRIAPLKGKFTLRAP